MSHTQYKKFLETLFAPKDIVCFMLKGQGQDQAPLHAFLPLEKAVQPDEFELLVGANKNADIYVAMNPFKPELVGRGIGRTEDNVAQVKRLYADADKDGRGAYDRIMASTKVPPPNVVLESSPGKFQFMWNVDGLDRETAKSMLRSIAQEFQTDPAVVDVCRVLRVPGFRNRKYAEAPEVKVVGQIDDIVYSARGDFMLDVRSTKDITDKPEVPRNERGKVAHGHIHAYMLREAGKLRSSGLDADEIYPTLSLLVHKFCEPPIEEKLVKRMADSICNFPPGEPPEKYALLLNTKPSEPTTEEITPELLAREFPAFDGQEADNLPMLVADFMPEGVTFFGSLPGTGKTWAGLSVTKALTTSMPLWGVFHVPQKAAVLYLIPEASDASFKRRLKKIGITQDKSLFRYRTISQGMTKPLTDPLVVAMVQQLASTGRKVLVIVDTAIRFLTADDENSSTENSLVYDSEVLRSHGASVLFLHHSPKASKEAAELTLENVLRGTGDFGAMADAVYGLRRDEKLYAYGEGPEEMEVVCVKARDMDKSPLPFRLALTRRPKPGEGERPVSVIDETQNMGYTGNAVVKRQNGDKLVALLKENPDVSYKILTVEMKMNRADIKELAKTRGWRQVERPAFNEDGTPELNAKGMQKKRWTWTNSLIVQSSPTVTEHSDRCVTEDMDLVSQNACIQ
jgi:hypothetical protein